MPKGFWKRLAQVNGPFIAETLRRLAREIELLTPGEPALGFVMFHNEGIHMSAIQVVDTSLPLNATVSFLDAEGSPTTADDIPAWSSSDDSVALATASEDGLSASVAIGAPGVALITVMTTNDDGSTAEAQGTITVVPGDAVIGDVSFSETT
jgi:hypothetical protein